MIAHVRQRIAAAPLGVALLALRVAHRIHPQYGRVFITHATRDVRSAIDWSLERGLYAKSQLESEDQHGS